MKDSKDFKVSICLKYIQSYTVVVLFLAGQVLLWKGQQPFYGVNDPKHVAKAVARAVRSGSRVAKFFNFHISLSCLKHNGCPNQYIVGKDMQSDKAASGMMNPKYVAEPLGRFGPQPLHVSWQFFYKF